MHEEGAHEVHPDGENASEVHPSTPITSPLSLPSLPLIS